MVEMLNDRDRKKADRAMEAMLQMKKLDIAELQRAFDGETASSKR
jgi:predicted 3-demethylubiquinone-9 3-methyltransferase (glyoxalase superfamily)